VFRRNLGLNMLKKVLRYLKIVIITERWAVGTKTLWSPEAWASAPKPRFHVY